MPLSNQLTKTGSGGSSGGIFSGLINRIKQPAVSPGSQFPKPKVGISMTGGIPQVSLQPQKPQISPPQVGVSSPSTLQQSGMLPKTPTPVSSPQSGLLPVGNKDIKEETKNNVDGSSTTTKYYSDQPKENKTRPSYQKVTNPAPSEIKPVPPASTGLLPANKSDVSSNVGYKMSISGGDTPSNYLKQYLSSQGKTGSRDTWAELTRLGLVSGEYPKLGKESIFNAAYAKLDNDKNLSSNVLNQLGLGTDAQKNAFKGGDIGPASGMTPESRANMTPEQRKEAEAKLESTDGKVLGTSETKNPEQPLPPIGQGNPMAPQNPYESGPDMYRKLVEGLANTPGSNANADFYRQQIANIMATQAKANKNIDLSGIDQSLAMGQQGVLNRYYTGLQQSAQSGLGNALQQQQLQQSALQGAAGLAAPQITSIGGVPYNPLTGEQGQMIGGPGGMFTLGQLQAQQGLGSQYAQGQTTLKAADNIQNQITQTLQQYPDLNASGVSMLSNLNEILSGQVSKPGQQLLKQQIESYISTLGIDPQTMMSIAAQSPGTMAQLLDSLRQTAQNKINALGGGTPQIGGEQTPTQSGGDGLWDW